MTVKNLGLDYLDNFETMLYGERIAHVIEAKGISKARIAEKLGISKQALNYLIKHATKPKFIDEFAELLEVDPKWLETGLGTSILKSVEKRTNTLIVASKEKLLGRTEVSTHEEIDFSCSNPAQYIAFKLEDNSNFPPFIAGSILIFNTSKSPSHEDYVLTIIGEKVFVRQYLKDQENVCYKANNNEHQTFINPKAEILGILIEARYKI